MVSILNKSYLSNWVTIFASSQAFLFIYLTSVTYAKVVRFKEEQFYLNPRSGEKQPFPSIGDKSTVLLSVIVPAYNEEKRCKNLETFFEHSIIILFFI